MLAEAARLRWRGRAIAWLLAAWIAGTALQILQPALWPAAAYWALGGVGVAAAAVGATLGTRYGRASLPLLAVASGAIAFAAVGLNAGMRAGQALAPVLEGASLRVVGVIAAMPQRSDAGQRFRFEVERATLDGRPVTLPPQLHMAWYASAATAAEDDAPLAAAGSAVLRAGDRWAFTARLKAPHGNLNPYGFDYELWLWEQGIGATGYVRTGAHDAPPERLGDSGAYRLERLRQTVRDRLFAPLGSDAGAGAEDARRQRAGILAALVTGDQRAIERADWDVFRATGVAHLMAISGLHITMFAWLAGALVAAGWRRSARWGWPLARWLPAPVAARVGGLLVATGYALFSGWGVPAQRTVLMLASFGLLQLAGLRWPWWLNWLAACAVVLAVDPWALTQAGFWLSFVAVGILFATDSGAGGSGGKRDGGRFLQLLREQWTVTLALTPLSLLLFGQVSLVGLLANLVAIPWVTLVITPLALAGAFWSPLWQLAGWLLAPLVAWLGWLAAWPWASVSLPVAPWWLGLAAVVGGVLLALPAPRAVRLAGLSLLLPALLWQPPRPAPGQFELLAADIGQGNAVLVRTASHALLYDAGPRYSLEIDAGHRELVPLLRALGERIDTLVLSHRDTDHTGGALAVLASQPQATLLSSIEDDNALQAVRPATRCHGGQQWVWDGVRFTVLHPAEGDYAEPRKSNAMSCVLRLEAVDGASALLVGDIEAPQEAQLVASQAAALGADVLLAPHHGSHSSSSAPFLDTVRPRVVLVQAGYRNRFGHPAPEVSARYAERGLQVADSPHCGAMHWFSVRPGEVRCERVLRPRYWRHRAPP